jgi:hypothetical protein
MGNTNGKTYNPGYQAARLPRPSTRRFTLPFEVDIYNTEGGSPNLLQISGARTQIEQPQTWVPFLDAAHAGAGCYPTSICNVTVRLLVDDGPNLKGVLSWIGPAPPNQLFFRRELEWAITERMSQCGVFDDEENWFCTLRSGTARVAMPRLNDYPLEPASPQPQQEALTV